MAEQIGRYRITGKLGEGNMGEVFSARDETLARAVAIKLVQRKNADPSARDRLLREARAAASVNHPNVCHIYEVGEHEGELFLAMELLQGEPLSARIARGPLDTPSAVEVACGILDALGALHRAGVVHRDLKPSNVFLTPHGVKLLDFGLARDVARSSEETAVQLTTPGTIVGTPRYMAPEQWFGSEVTAAADQFACGAILFEMLTGKAAFHGDSLPALCHSIVHGQPPALVGAPEVQWLERVINRALAKRPEDRYPDTVAMAAELRRMSGQLTATTSTLSRQLPVRTVKRLMVLPFRLLRADQEIDFLRDSLPDAITASLCGLQSLVVRSNRAVSPDADVRAVAASAGVDVILTGTLLRSGPHLRLTPQLIDGRDGTVIWSKPLQASSHDIFELQDGLTSQLMESLSSQLIRGEEGRVHHDHPATARAYELYLRAMHIGVNALSTSTLMAGRDLYREALREDPQFAPAWARLGRIYRVIAKYGHGPQQENRRLAEEAFRKALELNPDLPVAHNLYTHFEIEELGDAPSAMQRLLGRVRGSVADPDLYAGLVAACRFVGLFEASAAADQRARRLDPAIQTSIAYTLWFQREYERLAETADPSLDFLPWFGRWRMGRRAQAIEHFEELERRAEGKEREMIRAGRAAFMGDRATCLEAALRYADPPLSDPENWYFWSWQLALVEENDLALEGLRHAVSGNFCCHEALESEPEFASLRPHPEFRRLIEESRARHESARRVFRENGGEELLG